MAVLLLLALSSVLLGHVCAPWLARLRWPRRHPAPAIALWLAVLAGAVISATGLVAVAVFSPPGPGHRLIELAKNCTERHPHSGAVTAAVLSLVFFAGFSVAARVTTRRFRRTLTARRRHREMLGLVAHSTGELPDACVLDHPVPIAYCLPSRSRPIVVSSGALHVLDRNQLEAVLDHERAHLRGRHHLILSLTDAVSGIAPWAGTFRQARPALAQLVEQVADDAAARRHGGAAVSAALRSLAVIACPTATLGATGTGQEALAERLDRLDNPPLQEHGRRVAWAGALLSTLLPVGIMAGWISVIALSC